MIRAMMAAASGMAAEQKQLDAIAANLANAEVAGFKGTELSFGEIAAQLGTASAGSRLVLKQGKIVKSAGPLDMAIDGNGFFAVRDPRNQLVYTRSGDFARQADGTLRNGQGARLDGVRIPDDATAVSVKRDGRVLIDTALRKGVEVGRVPLARFAAPEFLRPQGEGFFAPTRASGKAVAFEPGTGNNALLLAGSLEQSNVTVVESMMQIIAAQRAFEANSKGVQAADEMQRIANNILRGNG
jgi:flagellar basal-body rod protein FlgG